ncbi:hypothetical protein AB0M48_29870 [Lentzea sp. NPDC051208]|uniref:hypothetical protein n=1 Tax=Lentzea sp. NPDC051208 TaxID=3154642 RepID=UPI0034349D63
MALAVSLVVLLGGTFASAAFGPDSGTPVAPAAAAQPAPPTNQPPLPIPTVDPDPCGSGSPPLPICTLPTQSTTSPTPCSGEGCIPQPGTTTTPPTNPGNGRPGQGEQTADDCGITDIGACITEAINAFFRGIVTEALNPLLDLLSKTLLTTPMPDSLPRVGELWNNSWQILLISYGLLVLIAGVTLSRTLTPRSPGGVSMPLFLPRVVSRWERDVFSLTQVNHTDVEILGRQFRNDNAPTLTRKALNAQRDARGQVEVVIADQDEEVIATQAVMPVDTIESDLVMRIMRANAVMSTVSEGNAAHAIARSFLAGAGITEQTSWRPEHGRLATARLTEWIAAQQTSRPAREIREVVQVRWPEPAERVEFRPPADRHLITSSADFTRRHPYYGWTKSVYEINSFDAYSTEFRLAALFDTSSNIKTWVRINETVPIRITYMIGAVQRQYEPDFIVIDDQDSYWLVEGKADSEMTNTVTLAKRDAARAWISTVNADMNVHDRWGYILASESVIDAASNWNVIRTAAQTFQ